MSASSFVKLLFFDKDINKTMNIESKMSAWGCPAVCLVERKCGVCHHDRGSLLPIPGHTESFGQIRSILQLHGGIEDVFQPFLQGDSSPTNSGGGHGRQHLAKLLSISPWCGLHVVIHDSYTTASHWPVSHIKNRQLRHIMKKLVANVLDEQMDTNSKLMEYLMVGFDK